MTDKTQEAVYEPGKTHWYFESAAGKHVVKVIKACIAQKTDFSVEFLPDGKIRIETWPRQTTCLMTTVSF